jgi:hypothetical protein
MPNMATSQEKGKERRQPGERKRGLLLRLLYRVYTNYLGVTPPRPEQERIAAAVLLGGLLLFIVGGMFLVRFLWEVMASASRGR